jgi:hypothetical protein
MEKAAAEFKVLANRPMAIRRWPAAKANLVGAAFDGLRRGIAGRVPKRGSEPRAVGLAGTRYGRGLNTPHYLTLFAGPSSRVRIRGGQRRCIKVPATKLMAIGR